MTKLVEKLSKADKEWRSNSVVLIDGAKYQTCKESIDCMITLGL